MKSNYKLTLKAALFALISLIYSAVEAQAKKPLPQLGKSSIKQVIAAITLQEKARLVVGMGFKFPGMPPLPKGKSPKPINIGGFIFPTTDTPVLFGSMCLAAKRVVRKYDVI